MKKIRLLLICLVATGSMFGQVYNIYNIINQLKTPHYDLKAICAHRGYWMENGVPENSLQAIKRAVQNGIEIVELDIKMSKDNIPYLMHDTYLRRTTTVNGSDRVWDWYMNDLRNLKLVDKNGNTTSYTVPSLSDALDYIKNNQLSVVLTLDIKDKNALQQCWNVVKSKTNYWGSNAADWVIFKLSADLYAQPNDLVNDLGLNSLFLNGTPGKYYFKMIQVFTTSMGSKFNCLARYQGFHGLPFFICGEFNVKQVNGILWPLMNGTTRGDSKSIAIFNPVPDAGTSGSSCGFPGKTVNCGIYNLGCYWIDGGWCKYQLQDLFLPGETTDNRWDWTWLDSWGMNLITTDDPVNLSNWLAGRNERNTNWYKYGHARMADPGEQGTLEAPKTIRVYPNPTEDEVTVSLYQDESGPVEFRVTDMTGQVVFTEKQELDNGIHNIVLSLKSKGVKPGLYLMQVTPSNSSAGKMVKISVK